MSRRSWGLARAANSFGLSLALVTGCVPPGSSRTVRVAHYTSAAVMAGGVAIAVTGPQECMPTPFGEECSLADGRVAIGTLVFLGGFAVFLVTALRRSR